MSPLNQVEDTPFLPRQSFSIRQPCPPRQRRSRRVDFKSERVPSEHKPNHSADIHENADVNQIDPIKISEDFWVFILLLSYHSSQRVIKTHRVGWPSSSAHFLLISYFHSFHPVQTNEKQKPFCSLFNTFSEWDAQNPTVIMQYMNRDNTASAPPRFLLLSCRVRTCPVQPQRNVIAPPPVVSRVELTAFKL